MSAMDCASNASNTDPGTQDRQLLHTGARSPDTTEEVQEDPNCPAEGNITINSHVPVSPISVALQDNRNVQWTSPSVDSGGSENAQCRICHEGEEVGLLSSQCRCSGSVALVHQTCLERWLAASKATKCELCYYEYPLSKTAPSLRQFFKTPLVPHQWRNLTCDCACFFVLTPSTAFSFYTCVTGAMQKGREQWQTCTLAVLAVVLIVIYVVWAVFVIHHHYLVCKMWREENSVVRLATASPVIQPNNQDNKTRSTIKPFHPTLPSTRQSGGRYGIKRVKPTSSTCLLPWVCSGGEEEETEVEPVPRKSLRPILKYSTALSARSWQSGIDSLLDDSVPPEDSCVNLLNETDGDCSCCKPVKLEDSREIKVRKETYV